MSANVLILSGYGLNCEEETLFAFNHVGINGKIIHINDLIENPKVLGEYQILAVPGGFSYGDDTGSGNAFAQKMKLALWESLKKFVERDTLSIGICNGCQILANLGLVPGFDGKYGERLVAVTYNTTARYQCRWVDVKATGSPSPWLDGIEKMHIPVAHGEGRFMMDEATLKKLQANKQIALQYVKKTCHPCESRDRGDINPPDPVLQRDDSMWELANGQFPYNPNGSVNDIAGITDQSGRVLALMPHPERGMFFWQRDDYHELKDAAQRTGTELHETADGLAIFQNAAKYFGVAAKKVA